MPAYLKIDVSDSGSVMQEYVILFPDEIKSIRLEQVSDDKFTPMATPQNNQYKLEKSQPSAAHYLWFRGFLSYAVHPDYVQNKRWKGDVAAIVNHVQIPEISTGLFDFEWGIWSEKSFSGFAADIRGEEPVLYEFDRVSIPRALRKQKFIEKSVLATYAIMRHERKPQSNIRMYTGHEIIARLAQIDVKRNF